MGTTSEKLTYLNETKQELKQAINNLGGDITSQTTFRNYVSQLENVYDNLPKTSFQEGTSVTLEGLKGKIDFDSDNGKKVVGKGDTEQNGEPSPTNEVPIQCVTGNQSIVESGKNECSGEIFQESKYLETDGTIASNPNYNIYKNSVMPNTNYSLSYKSTDTNNRTFRINAYNSEGNFISNLITVTVTAGNTQTSNITTPSNTSYILYSTGKLVEEMQLEQGTATPYEPYHTPITYPISLGSNKFYKIGDYADELLYDVENDKVYLNKNVNEHIFTESENISLQSINSYGIANFFIPHSLGSVSNLALCNYFTPQTSGISVTQEEGFLWQHNGVYFRIKSSTASDVSSFKTWLNSHSVEVEYALAETTKEEITGTLKDQIKALYNSQSYNGTTIIESNGDLPMPIKVRVLKGE